MTKPLPLAAIVALTLSCQSTNATVKLWEFISPGPASARILALRVDPRNPDTLYVATWNSGLFKSTDRGATWNAINDGLPAESSHALAVGSASPSVLYVMFDHPAGDTLLGPFLYKSLDGGATWTAATGDNGRLPVPGQVGDLLVSPADSDIVYDSRSEGIFKSTDGGRTWSRLPGIVGELDIATAAPETLYYSACTVANDTAVVGAGIYGSSDGGLSQHLVAPPEALDDACVGLIIDPMNPNVVYATNRDKIFKSADGGQHWNLLNLLANEWLMSGPAIDPTDSNRLVVVVRDANFNALRCQIVASTDGGSHWARVGTDLIDASCPTSIAFSVDGKDLFSITGRGFAKSTDQGASWAFGSPPVDNSDTLLGVAAHPAHDRVVYALAERGMSISQDGGSTWAPLPCAGDEHHPCQPARLQFDPADANTFYAVAGPNRIFFSLQNQRWRQLLESLERSG
ncbi:MAG: hypothetical protein U1F68_15795 [Gammaproteobacteria bacterium]